MDLSWTTIPPAWEKEIHTNLRMMRIDRPIFVVSALLFLLGCAPVSKISLPSVIPPATQPGVISPRFEKTFGEVSVGVHGSFGVRYKSLALLVSPGTDVGEAEKLRHAGFAIMKDLKAGQRVMMKKDDSFVFMSKLQTDSYLLEFDNGRNLFICGNATEEGALHEFVYSLRDDGKEIYEGFFYSLPGVKEENLARLIGLVQPKNALVIQPDGAPVISETKLQIVLKNEFYENPLVILKIPTQVPF